MLLDKNSFEEVGKISGGIEHNDDGSIESFTPANFILGFGEINKRKIVIGGEDFTVKGGSPNAAGNRKSVYTEELAVQYKFPLVRLHEGGGGSVAGPSKEKKDMVEIPVFSNQDLKQLRPVLKPFRLLALL